MPAQLATIVESELPTFRQPKFSAVRSPVDAAKQLPIEPTIKIAYAAAELATYDAA